MSIVRLLGSFPNSQIKPRSPVRESATIVLAVAASPGNTQVLLQDANRIKALIKNSGSFPIEYAYSVADLGLDQDFTLNPGASITVDGGGNDVFMQAIGGVGEVEIDDRVG